MGSFGVLKRCTNQRPSQGRTRLECGFGPVWLGANHLIAFFIVFKKLEETFGSIDVQLGPLLRCIPEGFNSSHAQELNP